MDPLKAYLIGLIGGDGCVINQKEKGYYYVGIVDPCKEFHEKVIAPAFEGAYGITAKVYPMKTWKGNLVYRTRIGSKKLVADLISFGIPAGSAKTFFMSTPTEILQASAEVKLAYVRGWMDAEGCVTTHVVRRHSKQYSYLKINFHVANAKIRDELCDIISEFGVKASKWANRNDGTCGFQMVGEKAIKYAEVIGFNHPIKISQLEAKRGIQWQGQCVPTPKGEGNHLNPAPVQIGG